MIKKDLLVEQAQQLGKVLAKMLNYVLHVDKNEDNIQAIEYSFKEANRELGLDISQMLELGNKEWFLFFDENQWQPEHIEQLAFYFEEIGRLSINPQLSAKYLQKSLNLLVLVDEKTQVYSFTRAQKIYQLKEEINEHNL